jgi:hypothetical protein
VLENHNIILAKRAAEAIAAAAPDRKKRRTGLEVAEEAKRKADARMLIETEKLRVAALPQQMRVAEKKAKAAANKLARTISAAAHLNVIDGEIDL